MIQLGLDLPILIRGFFTFEEALLDRTLPEMEDVLGYSKGRLKQGADIFILEAPTQISDFDRMGTSVFPGHRFEGSNLFHAVNGNEKKQEDLKKFTRKRLIKVVPLTIHLQAMRRFLSDKEYNLLKETDTQGRSLKEIMKEWKRVYANNPSMLHHIEQNYAKSKEIFERQDINDELYPPGTGSGVPQWQLRTPVLGRCVCRLTDYGSDRYQRII